MQSSFYWSKSLQLVKFNYLNPWGSINYCNLIYIIRRLLYNGFAIVFIAVCSKSDHVKTWTLRFINVILFLDSYLCKCPIYVWIIIYLHAQLSSWLLHQVKQSLSLKSVSLARKRSTMIYLKRIQFFTV